MHTAKFALAQKRALYVPVPTGVHARADKSGGLLALLNPLLYPETIALRSRDDYAKMLME